jgi:hypothetical protein
MLMQDNKANTRNILSLCQDSPGMSRYAYPALRSVKTGVSWLSIIDPAIGTRNYKEL